MVVGCLLDGQGWLSVDSECKPSQYRFEFTHKSVQEVIYSMLTVSQRQNLHYAYVTRTTTISNMCECGCGW